MSIAQIIRMLNIDATTIEAATRGFVGIYFIVANIFGFLIMFVDKKLAVKRKRRISEANLFMTGICGGALGVWASMYANRHKTKKNKFKFGIPLLVIMNMVIYIYLILNLG